MEPVLRTERLILREWRDEDRVPFAKLNSNPEVMKYFATTLSKENSDKLVDFTLAHFDEHGFGLWAVEIPDVAPFIGFVGLMRPRFEAHFTPCVEVGWRLAREHWNHGYATEAAKAAVQFGFGDLGLDEIVSFTVPANLASRRVMEKLGMKHDPNDNFEHPSLPDGHPLRPHVLYRLRRSAT